MSAIPKTIVSPEDYLAMERSSAEKNEYYKGEVFARAGAGNNHNIITANIISEIHSFLKGKNCTVYPTDMRLHIPENSLYTYPDVMVVCRQKRFLDDKKDTILNPVLIVEVLSPNTEAYDRGEEFRLYRSIPGLQEYMMVDSRHHSVEKYSRNEEGSWVLAEAQELQAAIYLFCIDFQLALQDVYVQVEDVSA